MTMLLQPHYPTLSTGAQGHYVTVVRVASREAVSEYGGWIPALHHGC